MRSRRMLTAGKPYELILRVREGLPFACKEIVRVILESALARSQRDGKVTLCHYLWMGNHVHIILVVQDAQSCVNFYQELKKKVTESYKRLMGKSHLSLWEGDPVLAEILDVEKAIEKIAYVYANPSCAHLVNTISKYPGVSSWAAFQSVTPMLNASFSKDVPWIRASTIPKLRRLNLSRHADNAIAQELLSKARIEHQFTIHPNAWMAAFGVEDDEVPAIHERIMEALGAKEALAALKRKESGMAVMGEERLREQPINAPHKPKKKERRIFVLSSLLELRAEYIARFRAFCEQCKECYRVLKQGGMPMWPPGALRPPAPPLASAI